MLGFPFNYAPPLRGLPVTGGQNGVAIRLNRLHMIAPVLFFGREFAPDRWVKVCSFNLKNGDYGGQPLWIGLRPRVKDKKRTYP